MAENEKDHNFGTKSTKSVWNVAENEQYLRRVRMRKECGNEVWFMSNKKTHSDDTANTHKRNN